MAPRLGTLLTAVATPMRGDGEIDLAGAERLFDHVLATGSDGLVVCGTTGEAPTLADAERIALWEIAVGVARGHRGATVVAGTGTYDTAHSVHLTHAAREAGVDGCLVVTPYYSKPPFAGIRAHFAEIAAVGLPVMIYNIPGRVVLELAPDMLASLAEIGGVVAVKQAISDVDRFLAVRAAAPDLDVYAGNDDVLVPFCLRGAVGGVCVVSQVAGELTRAAADAALAGDEAAAIAAEGRLVGLIEALAVASNPIPVKAALDLLDLPGGHLRLPMVPATADEREIVRRALVAAELLDPSAAAPAAAGPR